MDAGRFLLDWPQQPIRNQIMYKIFRQSNHETFKTIYKGIDFLLFAFKNPKLY